jgi:hypothetical protein
MTNEQFKSLRRGDIIRESLSGISFVVDAHCGDFIIAMKTVCIHTPSDWELCAPENRGSVDESSGTCKWVCACGQRVVGDFCACGAYRFDL